MERGRGHCLADLSVLINGEQLSTAKAGLPLCAGMVNGCAGETARPGKRARTAAYMHAHASGTKAGRSH